MPGEHRGPPRSTSPASPRSAPSPAAGTADVDLLINNAGVMVAAAVAAPPTASSCSSAPTTSATSRSPTCCCPHHRPRRHRLLDRAPLRHDRLRRPQLGAQAATAPGAPTGSPSSPTCCSPLELQRRLDGRRLVGARDRRPPRLRGHQPAVPQRQRPDRRPVGRSATGCSRRTRTAARCRPCTRRWPTSPATASPGPAASWSSAARRSWSGASGAAQDADVARRLWDVSEQLTGVRFPLGAKAAA